MATFIALSADYVISKISLKTMKKLGSLLINIGGNQPVQKLSNPDKKVGIDTGEFGIHPISGEHIPIWIANYVLSGYGDGAVMGVPGMIKRFLFAKKYKNSASS